MEYCYRVNQSITHKNILDSNSFPQITRLFLLVHSNSNLNAMFYKLSALALLSSAATAAPASMASRDAPYSWDVTGFTSTCTAATCRYDFNISGAIGPAGQPSFDATGCFGTSVQGEYKACSTVGIDVPGNVEAQEFNSGRDIGAIISVKYSFER